MSFASMIMLSLLYLQLAIAQSTTYLSPPPSYSDGRFNIPDTSKTQIFSEGSTMNVSWTTKYPSVNLYLLTGTDYNNPRTCLFGSTKTIWEWDVDDYGNNSLPFSFRIVNAQGTEEELSGGGFYTGQFWIRSDNNAPSSRRLTVDAVATSSLTTSSEITNTRASVSDVPATTSSSSSSTSSTMPTTTPSPSLAPVEDTADDKADGGMNTTAIGAGAGVGAGIVFTSVVIAIFMCCRRRRHESKQQQMDSQNTTDAKGTNHKYEAYQPQHQQTQAQGPYPQNQPIYEFASQSPVEVASGQGPHSEVAGSEVDSRTA